MHLLVNSESADFMKTMQLLNSNKGNAAAKFYDNNAAADLDKGNATADWSRREDIQAGTVKGCLSWTGRRYQAGTVRGRPNWFGSLLPEMQRTSSWFISWMLQLDVGAARRSSAEYEEQFKRRIKSIVEIISTSWLATSWKWSKAGASKQLEEQERTERAQLQTKRGADAEVAQRQIIEAEQPT
ncbi:hypothetical protein F511_05106 [Dorcoceras hygrometricum]|uniref:Uncharacterized protein n=1 Tax=Dorcoceras hygrometricum TaxID=472368 RepID=A0A2Z7BFW4_9LAMI|nr:hypothetical protein F511_05106 [Dorcoceras hygrometricum]